MTQLTLTTEPTLFELGLAPDGDIVKFNEAPIARATDPGTSWAAGREKTESGERASECEVILEAVRAYPGSTYRELWRRLRGAIKEPVEVQRRLNDLAALDPRTGTERPESRVVRGPARKCSESGRSAQTWFARTTGEGAR